MRSNTIRVVMCVGGGVTHVSGGIGTFIRYLNDEWACSSAPPHIRVVDTRGSGGRLTMAFSLLRAILLLVGLRVTGRVDLLHIHMSAYGSALRKGLLACIGRVLGIPVIIHMHGSNFREFYAHLPVFCQHAMRLVLNQAHRVIVLGSGWRDFLVSQVGVQARKVVIIFNGVPAPRTVANVERLPLAAPHIVFLGQLGVRKGVPELLTAFQLPQLRSRQWTATVAGDGEISRFRDVVTAVGLATRVAMPGWLDRDAASTLLQRADIFVLPSWFEAMPIAILEAMAHGVAVIATPVGAVPEFLTDGETALLVPPGAADLLADAIVRLLESPEERARLGAAGKRAFAANFDIASTAARILALYHSVLHRTAAGSAPPALSRAVRGGANRR